MPGACNKRSFTRLQQQRQIKTDGISKEKQTKNCSNLIKDQHYHLCTYTASSSLSSQSKIMMNSNHGHYISDDDDDDHVIETFLSTIKSKTNLLAYSYNT